MRSGESVTFDTVSHEGLLEVTRGRDPVAYFAGKGVPREKVLDAIEVAAGYSRHVRNFDVIELNGRHRSACGRRGARDVLKIETLSALPRCCTGCPAGNGMGALAVQFAGAGGITTERSSRPWTPTGARRETYQYGNVSVFTPIGKAGRVLSGFLPVGPRGRARAGRWTCSPGSRWPRRRACRSPTRR